MPIATRPRIAHQSMADRVAAELRRMVIVGEFEPGERLTQDKLAKSLGVSTMPVREALLRLVAEGLIIATPNRSFVVATKTADDLRDIFWLHSKLAGELARRCALNADDELVATLTELNQRYLASVDDIDKRFDANWEFFRPVHRSAGAPRLALVLRTALRFAPDLLRLPSSSPQHAARWQKDLLRAISKRDAARAQAVSEKYAVEAGEQYIKDLGL